MLLRRLPSRLRIIHMRTLRRLRQTGGQVKSQSLNENGFTVTGREKRAVNKSGAQVTETGTLKNDKTKNERETKQKKNTWKMKLRRVRQISHRFLLQRVQLLISVNQMLYFYDYSKTSCVRCMHSAMFLCCFGLLLKSCSFTQY